MLSVNHPQFGSFQPKIQRSVSASVKNLLKIIHVNVTCCGNLTLNTALVSVIYRWNLRADVIWWYCVGDFERGLKLPVSKMCDRYANNIIQVQLGMWVSLSLIPTEHELITRIMFLLGCFCVCVCSNRTRVN